MIGDVFKENRHANYIGNGEVSPEEAEAMFGQFLDLGDKCLNLVNRVNKNGNNQLLGATCIVDHVLPVGCALNLSQIGNEQVESAVYTVGLGSTGLKLVGEKKRHTDNDPFRVGSAQLVATPGSRRLVLSEDTFQENDRDKQGRRVIIGLQNGEKTGNVAELSEIQLMIKYKEFVGLANEAYGLESLFPDNYCSHSHGQVNVHYMLPDGWAMHCYPKPGTQLALLSERDIELSKLGNKYMGQYSRSNPFVAEWVVTDSIPGYGIWHERYTIRQKDGSGSEIELKPEDLSDLSVEFIRL